MRKFLKVTAIVGLALLVAAPAMALDFKFGAEYRVRFYSNLNGAQLTLGQELGVNATPTYFVNGWVVQGVEPEWFPGMIERLAAGEEP